MRHISLLACSAILSGLAASAFAAPAPDWSPADLKAFARQLTQYVLDHHLKQDPNSPQVGMVYEYYDVDRKLWVQGEALDTMHDGAWLANALVQMRRATGDEYYLQPLQQHIMPFYQKVLIHSDELFTDLAGAWSDGRDWQNPQPEKGFCPYFWDDGASVSLEQRRRETGKPNPAMRLDGYSHGTSNHMAQDLAVMLGMHWLLTRDEQTALAAKYLDESRRRHFGVVHAVSIAAAAANNDLEELERLADWRKGFEWNGPRGEYYDALFKGQERQAPGFLDGQSYGYHSAVLTQRYRPFDARYAKGFVYDTYANILLRDLWYDDAPPTPGIARFDLAGMALKGGRFEFYHSDRPDYPVGSRMGPMLIWASAIGLQMLGEFPGAWDEFTAAAEGDYEVPMLLQRPTLTAHPPDFGPPIAVGDLRLHLASTPRELYVHIQLPQGAQAALAIEPLPPAAGEAARISVAPDGAVTATGADGRGLLRETVLSGEYGGSRIVLIQLPYTA